MPRTPKIPTHWAACVAACCLLFVVGACTGKASLPTPSGSPVILAPATIPAATGICSMPLKKGSGGAAGPALCTNGDINILAWSFYAMRHPHVLSLGPHASFDQVTKALCEHNRNMSPDMEVKAYQLAAAYYSWSFTTDPSDVFEEGACL